MKSDSLYLCSLQSVAVITYRLLAGKTAAGPPPHIRRKHFYNPSFRGTLASGELLGRVAQVDPEIITSASIDRAYAIAVIARNNWILRSRILVFIEVSGCASKLRALLLDRARARDIAHFKRARDNSYY